MHSRIPRELPQPLPEEVQWHTQQHWTDCQRKLDHRWSEQTLPRRQRRDPVAHREPARVLEDGGYNHDLSGDRLVTVDGIRDRDSGDCRDGEAGEAVSEDQNQLPLPLAIIRETTDNNPDYGGNDIWDER